MLAVAGPLSLTISVFNVVKADCHNRLTYAIFVAARPYVLVGLCKPWLSLCHTVYILTVSKKCHVEQKLYLGPRLYMHKHCQQNNVNGYVIS